MTSLIVSPANKQEYILLKELLSKMHITYKPLSDDFGDEPDSKDWYRFAMINMSRAYSDDEPDYTSGMIKENNPEYNPSFESK